MNVVAVSTPSSPEWRWRIMDYAGQMIEESDGTFLSIESAVTDGAKRVRARDDRDVRNMPSRSLRPRTYRRNR